MAETTTEYIPPDQTQPLNNGGTQVSLRPVTFNAASLWESPCFWIVVGSALTLAAIYILRKRG